jgi:hypothetical protein
MPRQPRLDAPGTLHHAMIRKIMGGPVRSGPGFSGDHLGHIQDARKG